MRTLLFSINELSALRVLMVKWPVCILILASWLSRMLPSPSTDSISMRSPRKVRDVLIASFLKLLLAAFSIFCSACKAVMRRLVSANCERALMQPSSALCKAGTIPSNLSCASSKSSTFVRVKTSLLFKRSAAFNINSISVVSCVTAAMRLVESLVRLVLSLFKFFSCSSIAFPLISTDLEASISNLSSAWIRTPDAPAATGNWEK